MLTSPLAHDSHALHSPVGIPPAPADDAAHMARRDPQTLEQLLPRVLARLAEQSGQGRTLVPVWNATVGPHISKHTRPYTLEGGKLVVIVASAEWAQTLSRQEASLLEQLNARLGPGAVSALIFRLE